VLVLAVCLIHFVNVLLQFRVVAMLASSRLCIADLMHFCLKR